MELKNYVEEVVDCFKEMGVDAESITSVRNGIDIIGVRIVKEGNVSPVVWFNEKHMSKNAKETAWGIKKMIDNTPTPKFNLENITSPDYVKNHVKVGLERENMKGDYLSRPSKIPGISEYLYVPVNDNEGSYRVRKDMLSTLDLTEDKLWTNGYINTANGFTIENIGDILKRMGAPYLPELPMYVIGQRDQMKGSAAAALCETELSQFAKDMGVTDLLLIPSSVYECIVMPMPEDREDVENVLPMVRIVNGQEVDPSEQLSDEAYHISVGEEFEYEYLSEYLEKISPDYE